MNSPVPQIENFDGTIETYFCEICVEKAATIIDHVHCTRQLSLVFVCTVLINIFIWLYFDSNNKRILSIVEFIWYVTYAKLYIFTI